MGVWIETAIFATSGVTALSHPAWVCGLKLFPVVFSEMTETSHPAWVCGLKLYSFLKLMLLIGHTLRGCVD